MTTISLLLSTLQSRTARAAVELNGARQFIWTALNTPITVGALTKVFGGFLSALKGYLIASAISAIIQLTTLSFTNIWGMVVAAKQFIWNFNWNASDASLDASIKSAFNALGSQLGTTIGSTLGYLVCGALPASSLMTFNEPLALHVMEELTEEFAEEVGSNMAILVQQTARLLAQVALTNMYKNARSLYNEASNKFKQSFGISFPGVKEESAKASTEPWSFAMAVEEKVESIDNQFMQNLIEEGLEEFDDACIDAGYIIAAGIDSYLAAARAANNGLLGPDETVQILLNRP